MARYSKEYAESVGWNHANFNLEDEFYNLKYNGQKSSNSAKTKTVRCDGLAISKIRIAPNGIWEVYRHNYWQSFSEIKALAQLGSNQKRNITH